MRAFLIKLLSKFPIDWLRAALLRKEDVVTVSVILDAEFEDMIALNIGGYKEEKSQSALH